MSDKTEIIKNFIEHMRAYPIDLDKKFNDGTITKKQWHFFGDIIESLIDCFRISPEEAKEHLELELITQDDYDKLKNELSPIIMSSSDEKSETTQSESKKMSNWVYIAIVVCIFWLIGVMMPPTNSSSRTNVTYKYYCDECGDGISEQPYQCIFYKCTKARTVASGLDTFCSCSCGVEHMRRDGFQYTCN